jgi:hypothetical protein
MTDKELFNEGWTAAFDGVDRTDCPYKPEGCVQWEQWHDGWFEATMCRIQSYPRGLAAAFAEHYDRN